MNCRLLSSKSESDKYLNMSLSKEFLDEVPVAPEHSSVVNTDAAVEQLGQLLVARLAHGRFRRPQLRGFFGFEEGDIALKGYLHTS